MKIGDRVEILDCIYESDALCASNFGVITEIVSIPNFKKIYMVKPDNWEFEDIAYIKTELRVI